MAFTTTWDLSRYYAGLSDPRLQQDINAFLPAVESFCARWQAKLPTITTAQELADFYANKEATFAQAQRPGLFLFYLSTLDTQNTEVTKLQGKLEFISIEAQKKLLWIDQVWKTIGYETLMKWSSEAPLTPYRNAIVRSADTVKYLLEESQEKVLSIKSRALGGGDSMREELVGTFEFVVDGKVMGEEEVRSMRNSPNRDTREKAYAAIRATYNTPANKIAIGHAYNSVVKDWITDCDLRGFASVMSPQNTSEQLDDATVDLLMTEVTASYPLYHRYLRAKAKILGLDTLKISDVGAPIASVEKEISYEKAVNLHLSVMQDFDQEFYDRSLALLTGGRIDALPYKGKRGGAFCASDK